MNTGIIASRYADALLKYVKETGEGQVVYNRSVRLLTLWLHRETSCVLSKARLCCRFQKNWA